jgi:hypothetical protein
MSRVADNESKQLQAADAERGSSIAFSIAGMARESPQEQKQTEDMELLQYIQK